MNKKILLIVGIILIVVGCVVSYLADFQLADVTGFAVTMFGAGLASSSLWEKRNPDKSKFVAVGSIFAIGVGAFLLGFAGFAESTMTMIISSVTGIVAVIVGIIALRVNKKIE